MHGNPVMLPKGWEDIDGIRGSFNIMNIVKASVAHYTHQGLEDYNNFGSMTGYLDGLDTATPGGFDRTKELVDTHNRYHANEIIARSAGPLVGLFHIPIARCDGGECISGGEYDDWHKVKSGEAIPKTKGFADRNFPCIVGAYDTWDKYGEPNTRVVSLGRYLAACLLNLSSRDTRMNH